MLFRSGEKIQNLNVAVKDMLQTFRNTENNETEIHVAIISFGGDVKLHQSLTITSSIDWHDLSAYGGTPLGEALKMAKSMLEDKSVIPSRAYRPTVVLVSDGQPTDEWEKPLTDFIKEGRSSKCDRMAMAIGADADESILGKFIEGTKNPLFYAKDAKQMREFFKFVTMSVTIRTQSKDKNVVPEQSAIQAKPSTINERSEKSKAPTSANQSGTAGSSKQSNSEYW